MMETTNNNLRIDNPCPFVPTKRTKNDDGHYYKSCNKTVVDFRKKSTEEIMATLTDNACGIFTTDQLGGQKRFSFSTRAMLYGLSILSFLGFTIHPISTSAMNSSQLTDYSNTKNLNTHLEKEKPKEKRDKKSTVKGKAIKPKKKKVYRTIGSASFWR